MLDVGIREWIVRTFTVGIQWTGPVGLLSEYQELNV